jgi:poly-gamma-glutamate synthesis protein (capsule biosynthesis protein)
VHVEPPGRPVAATGPRAAEVVEYVAAITVQAGLPAVQFERGETAWTVH